jgi:hypothetical protein
MRAFGELRVGHSLLQRERQCSCLNEGKFTLFLFAVDVDIVFGEFLLSQLNISFGALVNELLFVDLGGHGIFLLICNFFVFV